MVTVYGHHSDEPWDDPDGARFIGNELRRCNYVGLYLKFPVAPVDVGCVNEAKHVITAWGDELVEQGGEQISVNPDTVHVTDSDETTGPPVQTYNYDPFEDNNRWAIDYAPSHPFFVNIVTLSPPDEDCDGSGQIVVGSHKITQNGPGSATDLHYIAGTDVRICEYDTSIDWPTDDTPQIVKFHKDSGDEYIKVDWEFALKEAVPLDTVVTITTKFTLPRYNGIYHDDVYFTYEGAPGIEWPSFGWSINTPLAAEPGAGGYVVGSFVLYDDPAGGIEHRIGEYRFQHEYAGDQDRNYHEFELVSLELTGYYIGDLRFGHSCTLLDTQELWDYGNYIDEVLSIQTLPVEESILFEMEWAEEACVDVPAVSDWGLVVFALLVVTAGTVLVRQKRAWDSCR